MDTPIYDYEHQRWVTCTEAISVRQQQLEEELQLLTGQRGAEYLSFTAKHGQPGLTLEQAIAKCKAALEEFN